MDVTENPPRIEEARKGDATLPSVNAALAACPSEVRDCLEAAHGGAELSFEQGLLLATTEGAALDALVVVADTLRRETGGGTVTYLVNRHINFTHVGFLGWSFCGFPRGGGAP